MSDTLITILLAIVTILSTAIFANNMHADKKMWDKLDRITNLMMAERDLVRAELVQVRGITNDNCKDIAEMKGHLKAKSEIENNKERA